MPPQHAPRFVALVLAMCVALIAPTALAGEADEPADPPPSDTTTTTVASTTTTTTAPDQQPPPADDPPSDPPPDETVEPSDGEVVTEMEPPAAVDELPEEEEIEFDPLDPEQVTRDILFPVVGASVFSKGFGD